MLDVEVIADAATAVLALDPIRNRLLAELRQPESAASVAGRVGLTRQKANYYLRDLERHGLVATAGERRWGGLTERLFVATARSYVVSPEVKVRRFEVVAAPEVSDHRALLLDID